MARTFIARSTASSYSHSGALFTKQLTEGAASTSATESITVAANTTIFYAAITNADIPGTKGGPGTYNIEVDYGSGGVSNIQVSVALNRVNSSNVIQTTSATSSEQALSSSPTFTFSNLNLGTWNAGDKLLVIYYVRNAGNASRTFTIEFNTALSEVITPFGEELSITPSITNNMQSTGSASGIRKREYEIDFSATVLSTGEIDETKISLVPFSLPLEASATIQSSGSIITKVRPLIRPELIDPTDLTFDIIKPISDSPLVRVVGDDISTSFEVKSELPVTTISELNPDKNTISISTYFYSTTQQIQSVDIGYQINNLDPVFENFPISSADVWAFISASFDISEYFGSTGNINIIFKINLNGATDAEFLFNGFSLGQWNESFSASSSGIIPQEIDAGIFADTEYGVATYSYGGGSKKSYYLIDNNELLATNEGFPIIYGASSVTRLHPSDSGMPSVIIPSEGFLNESGRYKEYSVEFWTKIPNSSVEPFRFFGPIRSQDGLYLDNGSLVLKIDTKIASFFINEFDRPMLIAILYGNTFVKVLLNGEQIINLEIENESITLPSPITEESLNNNWLGFYVNQDIEYIDIDAFAIYPYIVSNVVAKRRFAYGQAVDYPQSIAGYGTASAVIDYSVAGYTNNYLFPDMTKWDAGITKNAEINSGTLSTPNYILPTFDFINLAYSDWLTQCKEDSEAFTKKFFVINNNSGYIYYDSINVFAGKEKPNKIFGYFQKPDTLTTNKILFKFINKSLDSLIIYLTPDGILYDYLGQNGTTLSILNEQDIDSMEYFIAGIDIDNFVNKNGSVISKFFGNIDSVSMYVLNSETLSFSNQFTGNVYGISFGLKDEFLQYANSDGFLYKDVSDIDDDFILQTSYMLYAKEYLGEYLIDIATKTFWQDFLPLSYFSKNIDYGTNEVDTLDFLQINFDLPTIIKNSNYDSANSKVYFSLQYLNSGANDIMSTLEPVAKTNDNIVIPGSNWLPFTRYEILDNAIVYLPKGVNFKKLAIVFYVQLETDMAIVKPVFMKTLQVASQALRKDAETAINTKFGITMFPYLNRGIYNDFNSSNPFSIYKGTTPYMYLTKKSGIELRNTDTDSSIQRGIKISINQEKSPEYLVGAIQVLARYSDIEIPSTPQEVFFVKTLNKTISFYVAADNNSGTRGRLYAINKKTLLPESSIVFFLNGKRVKNLYIKPNQWNMIGIQFLDSLNFSNYTGYFSVTGPFVFNAISNYRYLTSESGLSLGFRKWQDIEILVDEETSWQELVANGNWEKVLYVLLANKTLIDPVQIYNKFVGIDKIVVTNSSIIKFKRDQYRTYKNIEWDTKIISVP